MSIAPAGIVVNAMAAAVITLVKVLVPRSRGAGLLFWLTGFLDVPSPSWRSSP